MNTRTYIAIDSSKPCARQRLAVLVIVSVVLHGGILLFIGSTPDILPEPDSSLNQTIQIHLTPNSRSMPDKQAREELPGKALDAWQLIERSLDHIRSRNMTETDRLPTQSFGQAVPDSHLDHLVTTVKAQAPIETYRAPGSGNIRVKMSSMFGGFQCFEILAPDPLDAFSSGVWLLVRC